MEMITDKHIFQLTGTFLLQKCYTKSQIDDQVDYLAMENQKCHDYSKIPLPMQKFHFKILETLWSYTKVKSTILLFHASYSCKEPFNVTGRRSI